MVELAHDCDMGEDSDGDMEVETSIGLEDGEMGELLDASMEVESVAGSLVGYNADLFEDSDAGLYEDPSEASDKEDETDYTL